MQDSIYEAAGDDYPSEDAEEIIAAPYLIEEFRSSVTPDERRLESLDDHVAKRTYAFATRQEKYELYKRFRTTLEPDCLHPCRKKK